MTEVYIMPGVLRRMLQPHVYEALEEALYRHCETTNPAVDAIPLLKDFYMAGALARQAQILKIESAG